jgi:hypothetical protein
MSDPDSDPIDHRVLAYLKSRAAVDVPRDVLPSAMQRSRSERGRTLWGAPMRVTVELAAAVLVIAVIAIVGINLPHQPAVVATPPASTLGPESFVPTSEPSAFVSPAPSASAGVFPATVDGMPVISVAQADALLKAGKLDGRAVAVSGYFVEEFLPCPAPMRFVAPLEDWCRFVVFTDEPVHTLQCDASGKGCSWGFPDAGTPNLAPYLMTETTGTDALWPLPAGRAPPMVAIGHADDPRQWQCPLEARNQCGNDFVADRIAWLDGSDVVLSPSTSDVSPSMSLSDVVASAGIDGQVVAAVALKASDVSTVDPRWNFVGDNTVWAVRSLGTDQQPASADVTTRPEKVWIVDDSNGHPMAIGDLAMASDYRPARLSVTATRQNVSADDRTFLFYRVETLAGVPIQEMEVGSWAMTERNTTTYGPGLPTILDPGTYKLSVWLSVDNGGQVGPPTDECTSQFSVSALDDITMNADFSQGGPCALSASPTN